jgi:hypothetical protein
MSYPCFYKSLYTQSILTKNRTSPPPTSVSSLTGPNSWARRRVAGRNRVVNVDQNTRVASLVSTRESNRRAWVSTSTVLDLDLGARNVKLRTTGASSAVQSNVLDTEQVLARRQGLGQGESDLRLAAAGKGHLTAGEGGALRVDLEPDGAGAVEGCGSLAGGDLGHVELEGTRVRDGSHGSEADGVAGVDSVGLRSGARGKLVAADLLR